MTAPTESVDFADVVGVNVRSRMLQHLAECDEPKKQYQIAETLGVSQASVSRCTHDLLEAGVIQKDDKDLISIHPDAETGVGMFREAIKNGASL